MKESRICMLDLEMSGLDPDSERIIEVACFVVEADLTPVPGAEMCHSLLVTYNGNCAFPSRSGNA